MCETGAAVGAVTTACWECGQWYMYRRVEGGLFGGGRAIQGNMKTENGALRNKVTSIFIG